MIEVTAAATIPRGATAPMKTRSPTGRLKPTGGQPDAQRTCADDEQPHNDETRRAEPTYVVERYVCREQHEQKPDKHDGEAVLELPQFVADPSLEIAHDHPGNGDGHEAALRDDRTAPLEQQDDGGQGKDVLVPTRRHEPIPQSGHQDESCHDTRRDPEAEAHGDQLSLSCQCFNHRGGHDLKDGRSQQRTDRVDEYALRLEHSPDPWSEPHVSKHRPDNGRAGHHDEGAEQEREIPRPTQYDTCQPCGGDDGDDRTDRDETPDGRLLTLDPRPLEVEPTLEQDDGDTEVDNTEQPVTKCARFDSRHPVRSQERTGSQQQHDRRETKLTRDRLCQNARRERDRQPCGVHRHSIFSHPRKRSSAILRPRRVCRGLAIPDTPEERPDVAEPVAEPSDGPTSNVFHAPSIHLNLNARGLSPSATLAVNELCQTLTAGGREVFKLGLGQSPFPVPSPVVDALKAHAHCKDYLVVRGLAAYHSQSPHIERRADHVLIGPGSKELMFLLQMVYYGDIVIPTPAWVSYAPQTRIIGRHVRWIQTTSANRWRLQAADLERTCATDPDRPRIVVLNSPTNPTGQSYDRDALTDLAAIARKYRVIVLSDEIYAEIHHGGNHLSIAEFYQEGTIISTGLSKWCGAGGWRLWHLHVPRAPHLAPRSDGNRCQRDVHGYERPDPVRGGNRVPGWPIHRSVSAELSPHPRAGHSGAIVRRRSRTPGWT